MDPVFKVKRHEARKPSPLNPLSSGSSSSTGTGPHSAPSRHGSGSSSVASDDRPLNFPSSLSPIAQSPIRTAAAGGEDDDEGVGTSTGNAGTSLPNARNFRSPPPLERPMIPSKEIPGREGGQARQAASTDSFNNPPGDVPSASSSPPHTMLRGPGQQQQQSPQPPTSSISSPSTPSRGHNRVRSFGNTPSSPLPSGFRKLSRTTSHSSESVAMETSSSFASEPPSATMSSGSYVFFPTLEQHSSSGGPGNGGSSSSSSVHGYTYSPDLRSDDHSPWEFTSQSSDYISGSLPSRSPFEFSASAQAFPDSLSGAPSSLTINTSRTTDFYRTGTGSIQPRSTLSSASSASESPASVRPIPIPHPMPLRRMSRSVIRPMLPEERPSKSHGPSQLSNVIGTSEEAGVSQPARSSENPAIKALATFKEESPTSEVSGSFSTERPILGNPVPAYPARLLALSTSCPNLLLLGQQQTPTGRPQPSPYSGAPLSTVSATAKSPIPPSATLSEPLPSHAHGRRPLGRGTSGPLAPVPEGVRRVGGSSLTRVADTDRQRRSRTRSAAPDLLQLTLDPSSSGPSPAPGSPAMPSVGGRPMARRKPSYVPPSATLAAAQVEEERSNSILDRRTGLLRKGKGSDIYSLMLAESRAAKSFRWTPDRLATNFVDLDFVRLNEAEQALAAAESGAALRRDTRSPQITESPSLQPTLIADNMLEVLRSPSPVFFFDDDGLASDVASTRSESPMPAGSRALPPSSRLSNTSSPKLLPQRLLQQRAGSPGLSSSRNSPPPLTSPIRRFGGDSDEPAPASPGGASDSRGDSASDAPLPTVRRTLSDGDLSDFFKSFQELKAALRVTKAACDTEVQKVVAGLQEFVEKELRLKNTVPIPRAPSGFAANYHRRSDSNNSNSGTRAPVGLEALSSSPPRYYGSNSRIVDPLEYGRRLAESGFGGRSPRQLSSSPLNEGYFQESSPEPNPFEEALHQLISIAQRVLDMDASTLMSDAEKVRSTIDDIRNMQQKWDLHSDWSCKPYVIRLLMAFASVARVVEQLGEDERWWSYLSGQQESAENLAEQGQRSLTKSGSSSIVANRPDITSNRRPSFASIMSADSTESPAGHSSPRARGSSEVGTMKRVQPPSVAPSPGPPLPEVTKQWSALDLNAATEESKTLTVLMEMNPENGQVQYVSRSCLEVFGYDVSEIVGQSRPPFTPEIAHRAFISAMKTLYTSGDRISMEIKYRAVRKDGRMLDMVGNGVLMTDKMTGSARSVFWVSRPVGLVGDGWDDVEKESEAALDLGDRASLNSSRSGSIADDEADEDGSTSALHTATPKVAQQPSADLTEEDQTATMRRLSEATPISGGTHAPSPGLEMVLCHVCDRKVPPPVFERHSNVCVEVHRAEYEIVQANEDLREYKNRLSAIMQLLHEELEIHVVDAHGLGIPVIDLQVDPGTPGPTSPPRASTDSSLDNPHDALVPYLRRLLAYAEDLSRVIEDGAAIPTPDGDYETNIYVAASPAYVKHMHFPAERPLDSPSRESDRAPGGTIPRTPPSGSEVSAGLEPPSASVSERIPSIEVHLEPEPMPSAYSARRSSLPLGLESSSELTYLWRWKAPPMEEFTPPPGLPPVLFADDPLGLSDWQNSPAIPPSLPASPIMSSLDLGTLNRAGTPLGTRQASVPILASSPVIVSSSGFPLDSGSMDSGGPSPAVGVGFDLFNLHSSVETTIRSKIEACDRMIKAVAEMRSLVQSEEILKHDMEMELLRSSESEYGSSEEDDHKRIEETEPIKDERSPVLRSARPASISSADNSQGNSSSSPDVRASALSDFRGRSGAMPSEGEAGQSALSRGLLKSTSETEIGRRGRRAASSLRHSMRLSDSDSAEDDKESVASRGTTSTQPYESASRRRDRTPGSALDLDMDRLSLNPVSDTDEGRSPNAIFAKGRRSSRTGILLPGISDSIRAMDSDFSSSPQSARFSTRGMEELGRTPPSASTPISVSALTRSQPSIKDFEVIKPISKGAYGAVYLAKKRNTGDYYAIKCLRKSDMVAKNQVTNIRNERMILTQLDSDFVVKLYFSFQTKDNLYLVMEYLNGGDCAALIKAMGALDEKWAKQYIAEVVSGLEFLHARGIIHRDLKPDNLLIDSNGHLKLTDFGLSRVGFLGRRRMGWEGFAPAATQSSPIINSPTSDPSVSVSGSGGRLLTPTTPTLSGSISMPASAVAAGGAVNFPIGSFPHLRSHSRRSSIASTISTASSSVEGLPGLYFTGIPATTSSGTLSGRINALDDLPTNSPNEAVRFVGTPDYLAPESILGLGQDASVDWWALGVITYEFLFGVPPFHASTPQQVFENILARNIDWQEDEVDISPEARDFMERLMCTKVEDRLGKGGAAEVKAHPWLADVDWNSLFASEAGFVPKPSGVEDTFYFDDRGAAGKKLSDEGAIGAGAAAAAASASATSKAVQEAMAKANPDLAPFAGEEEQADFGSFAFKNLQLLEKANTDTMEKLRSEMLNNLTSPTKGRRRTLTSSSIRLSGRSRTLSFTGGELPGRTTQRSSTDGSLPDLPYERDRDETKDSGSVNSGTASPKLSGTPPPSRSRSRQPRERRGSAAGSSVSSGATATEWKIRGPAEQETAAAGASAPAGPSSSAGAVANKGRSSPVQKGAKGLTRVKSTKKILTPFGRTFNILVAEDNIISAKILEAQLNKLGGLCVFVTNGAEAVHAASGDVKFDMIVLDIVMPILTGDQAAHVIRSVAGINQTTPILGLTAYEKTNELTAAFDDVLTKPVSVDTLREALRVYLVDNGDN